MNFCGTVLSGENGTPQQKRRGDLVLARKRHKPMNPTRVKQKCFLGAITALHAESILPQNAVEYVFVVFAGIGNTLCVYDGLTALPLYYSGQLLSSIIHGIKGMF